MGGSDRHGEGGAGGACNKGSRKASSLTDDDKGETSRCRRLKICQGEDAPTSGRDDRSSAGEEEEDYMYESDDGAVGEEEEEDYIYDNDDDEGVEEGGAEQQAQDDDADAPAAAAAGAGAGAGAREQRYVVLTEADIRARQEADTAKVAEVLSIPLGFAAVLLRHFKWRVGRVQEEWFTDDARVRGAVGLSPDQLVPVVRGAGAGVCGICFDEFPARRTAAAGCCAHFYCDECWQGYVRAAVADGPRCLDLRCPDPSCSAPVVRELVAEVLSGSAADDADRDAHRYARFWLRSYVEESGGKVRWCGGAGCAHALEFLGSTAAGDGATSDADVFCACGHGACWSCGEEAHRPVSCATVRAWLAKNSSADSAETANWVVAHTKPCPKCGRPIEKNQGCNHMRCSPPCGHHFCWLCLQPAGGANHYACNDSRATAAADAAADDATAATLAAYTGTAAEDFKEEMAKRRRAQAALERYLHHYERWVSNRLALESAARDVAKLERGELERMARCADVPSTELAFVAEAYREIADGRRVLRWAHAYGYFLDPERDGAKRALFDDLQNQANRWLECLHAAAELERKDLFGNGGSKGKAKAVVDDVVVEAEAFRAYRQKVANLTRVTRMFLGNLVRAFETDLPEVAAAANPSPAK